MLLFEFRVVLPMTVEEYQVAQLYSVAEASKAETGGGEGIEVINNEPYTDGKLELGGVLYDKGQFTKKIYHLASKVPKYIQLLAPRGSLEIYEEAWNAYPYCKTVLTNPEYMKENFYLIIETIHKPDRGETENAHQLSKEELAKRVVVPIDIANNSEIESRDQSLTQDPSKYHSEKTGRGPLKPGWQKTHEPIMCAYKLVRAEFKWFGLQNRVEKFIMKTEKRLFSNFHRQLFCWMDQWHGLTMEDIRRLEDKTKEDLDKARRTGSVKGTRES